VASRSVFGVTGGATGVTEKQIFTFTKSGAVPIGTACIENGIFKLNKSLNKKTYINTNKKQKAQVPTESGGTNDEKSSPVFTNLENEVPKEPTQITTHIVEPISISLDSSVSKATDTTIQLPSDPALNEKSAFQDFHDDGYYSANSPSSSNEDMDMDVDILDLDKEKTCSLLDTTNQNNEHVDYVQEFPVENILDTDGLSFQLITEETNEDTDFTIEYSSDTWEDLSSKLIDEERDPTWHPQEYELEKIAVFDNKDLHEALFPEEDRSSLKRKKTPRRKPQKYRRGPTPMSLDKIDDEEKKRNILRCREYRNKKNEVILEEMTELEKLEAKNIELKQEEQALRDKVKKFKDTYLKLISEGRIRFC